MDNKGNDILSGKIVISRGSPYPLGITLLKGGVNFAVFSRHATGMRLLLFEEPSRKTPDFEIDLDPRHHRMGDIWYVQISGIGTGWSYCFKADGPYLPEKGFRFNIKKALVDPYARALHNVASWDFDKAKGYDSARGPLDLFPSNEDNTSTSARALIMGHDDFDWKGDSLLKKTWCDTIIYETHVRGLTIHPSSAVKHPGTYLGLVEKIPYLQELGITAVELLPVQDFNENELTTRNPLTGERLKNYWGYSPVGFFAPKQGYASSSKPGDQVKEFKKMVRQLHKAGIEVILDVVFNHTAEGDELGPTLHLRGFDNSIYYILDNGGRRYKNFSGCGNTLNCNHPVVRDFILECLRHWVVEMHVDGFRFDLASVLGRDNQGNILPNPPVLEHIAEDPILRDVKLIAEAWDVGGAYQVGNFHGSRWSEWNGRYRDDVRRFWRGDRGMVADFASRLCGSADLYEHSGKQPLNSINFVTCHDGFTLHDLVTYSKKHNEANGEENRDGSDTNFSANYGVEGETDDPEINRIRTRQIKNMMATLLLSRGVPMILGGDEFRRTQRGNNNAYCQDNEISWYNWEYLDSNREIYRFTKEMIAFRKRHPVLRRDEFYKPEEITWFDSRGEYPDWSSDTRHIGCVIHGHPDQGGELCLIFNAEPEPVVFDLPRPAKGNWFLAVDTAAISPADIFPPHKPRPVVQSRQIKLVPRSLVVLAQLS